MPSHLSVLSSLVSLAAFGRRSLAIYPLSLSCSCRNPQIRRLVLIRSSSSSSSTPAVEGFRPTAMEVDRRGSCWTREEEKAFENGLAAHPEDCGRRWEKIAAGVPGRSVEEVKEHYELLVEDVDGIEAGRVPLPRYPSSSSDGGDVKKGIDSGRGGRASPAERERGKGIAWTEDEHRLFLLGLNKYGKGDWRSISRNFVVSRTPTQVASHAQKYFIRLNSMNKDRRRMSIHDITTAGKPTEPSSQPSSSGPSFQH